MNVKTCNICKGEMVPGAGICGDFRCLSNLNRIFSAYQLLEKHIYDGDPPDSVGQECDSQGRIRIVFRWRAGGKALLKFNIKDYGKVLARYVEFWRGPNMTVKERGGACGGTGNKAGI